MGRRKFECGVCHYEHNTQTKAQRCERQGVRENPLKIGDQLSYFGTKSVVVRTIRAMELSHKPGAVIRFSDETKSRARDLFSTDEDQVVDSSFVKYRIAKKGFPGQGR